MYTTNEFTRPRQNRPNCANTNTKCSTILILIEKPTEMLQNNSNVRMRAIRMRKGLQIFIDRKRLKLIFLAVMDFVDTLRS